jgi:hypothetical protein
MNALFLVSEPITDFSGISKKILAQVSALKYHETKVSFSYLKANGKYKFSGRYVDDKIIDSYSPFYLISKFQRRYKYKNLYKYIKSNKIDFVYIRYIHFANPFFISFLKKLKKTGIIVLLELPTYPYDQEYKNASINAKMAFGIEKFYRKKFKYCVSRIITVGHHTSIFGVPCIHMNNGIDVNSIKVIEKSGINNEMHMIGVATISVWHGYDRVIEGLFNYYKNPQSIKKKVHFHIVGEALGIEAMRYAELVKKYNLTDYVHFYGKRSGKDLDDLFNSMDIAVGSIGCHRIGLKYIKSLKNREYCARGIPFFYSETDEDFEDKPFTFKVAANDDPIDIERIINFLNSDVFDARAIRKYAVENLTWQKHFGELLEQINKLKNQE